MKPFFFGEEGKQLYGVYHQPVVTAEPAGRVLICNALGHEHLYSHRSLSLLARRLASDGFHVLRFDYFGTGNSAGHSSEGSVAQWKADVRDAAEELGELSGASRISILGLRAGAALASAVSSAIEGIRDLVLWDPVVCGAGYLAQLQEMHERVVVHRSGTRGGYGDQLLGFPYPEALRRELSELNLVDAKVNAERIVLLTSEAGAEADVVRAHLESSSPRFEARQLPGSVQWYTESGDPYGVRLDGAAARVVSSLFREDPR